jgi:hypothetical protein
VAEVVEVQTVKESLAGNLLGFAAIPAAGVLALVIYFRFICRACLG